MPLLSVVSLALALAATAAGVVLFARGAAVLVRNMRLGRPAPERTRPPLRRAWLSLAQAVGHQAFRGRPLIRAAHWVVMVSFPVLVLTLLGSYGQLVNPSFHLPLVGQWPVFTWLAEFFAWAGTLGIVALMVVRSLTGRGRPADAAPDAAPDAASTTAAPETPTATTATAAPAGTRFRLSRFLGSSWWQARYVEWTILGVVVCVLALRALEWAYAANLFEAYWLLPGGAQGSGGPAFNPYGTDPAAPLAHSLPVDAPAPAAPSKWVYPLTWFLGEALRGLSLPTLQAAITLTALAKILISTAWFAVVGLSPAMGVAWHRFLAFVNIYGRRELDGSKALGPVAPLLVDGTPLTPELTDELDDDAVLGTGTIADFTWKGLLDFSTCTECGRCQEVCPAWNTGKPLSPKLLVMSLRDHHHAAAPFMRAAAALGTQVDDVAAGPSADAADLAAAEDRGEAGGASATPASIHGSDLLGALMAVGAAPEARELTARQIASQGLPNVVGSAITPEVLWSCTNCGACTHQCPVDIEHVDHIVNLRRHQVLMESAFPSELGKVFRGLETKGNPWNAAARKRMEWAKGLDFDVPVLGEDVEDATEVDFVMFVGCAGAFEDRAKKTTAATAQLLHIAGVSFAVLGSSEGCSGDPARRAGNEVLFQLLASANIEALQEAKAKRIIVSCAHCFNTIAREYPQLGGSFEVLHHTQVLNTLVREGRLRPVPPPAGQARQVTFHDPCFLGRHNQVYTPPRELLAAASGGAQVVEMPRNRDNAMCCGAGGARVWMEESLGVSIGATRAAEAASTGAQVVATACPFCTTMLTDGTNKNAGSDGQALEVRDVAQLMLEAVRRGQEQES
ncbi:(Fe-S)-binding protein [Buchananella felis]|uniref:(Fe-S)-binding protein n=1 Tax=Buchananella felis TaxID=3231492 RepID=UPI0035282E6F